MMRFQAAQCAHGDIFSYITELLNKNASAENSGFNGSCDRKFISRDGLAGRRRSMKSDLEFLKSGQDFYAYVTPFIILVGIIGNSISLGVFCSPRMRKMSASIYLASLAGGTLWFITRLIRVLVLVLPLSSCFHLALYLPGQPGYV